MQFSPRYRVLRSIGAGGAGRVYLAQDRLGGGRVVIKALQPGAEGAAQHISTEFLTLAGLAIRGVARLLDFGWAPGADGQDAGPYLVRTFIEGPTLAEAIEQGADREQSISWVAQAAHSVSALHRRGVIHGDIKPSNVIIDADSRPWLIDLGLASTVTNNRQDRVGGTPAFMAPELLAGSAPTMSSDVYALGATLWAVLCGHAPFDSLSGVRRMRHRQRYEDLQPPASATPALQMAYDVARKALHPDPARRTASAAELLAGLELMGGARSGQHQAHDFVPPLPRGRHACLDQLEALVTDGDDAPQAPAKARLIWVQADEGMGKSTLLRILRWRLQLRGSCVLSADIRGQDAFGPAVSLLQQASLWLNQGHDQPPMDPQDSGPDALRQAFVDRVSRLRQQRPLVLMIDDLADAEPFMLDWLRAILYRNEGHPVVLVAGGTQPFQQLSFDSVVTLQALTEGDVHRLTSDALGAVDESVHAAIWQRSEGHPAKALNLLTQLSQRDHLSARDVLSLMPADFESALAQQRYRAMDRACQLTLQAVAIAGGELPTAILMTQDWRHSFDVSQDPSVVLQQLEHDGHLERKPDSMSLTESAVAGVALGSLDDGARSCLAVALLNSASASTLTFQQCAQLALCTADRALMQKYVPGACETLISRGATARATDWYGHWISFLDGPARHAVALRLVELHQACGGYGRAREWAQTVLTDPTAAPSDAMRAHMLLCRLHIAQGQYQEALAILEAAQRSLPSSERGHWYRALALVNLNRGEYQQTIASATQGLAASGLDDAAQIELLTAAGMAHDYLGHQAQAEASYARALDLARASNNTLAQSKVLNYRAISEHRKGNFDEARDLYASSLELARALDDVGSIAMFSLNLGTVESLLGRYAAAEQHYLVAIQSAKLTAKHSTELMASANLAHLKVALGMYAQARNLVVQVIADAKRQGIKRVEAQALALMGDIEVRSVAAESGLEQFAQALALFESLGQTREMAETHLDAAEARLVYLKSKELAPVRAHLTRASELLAKGDFDDLRARLALVQALLELESGRLGEAATLAEQALKDAQGRGDQESSWRLRFVLARAYPDTPHKAMPHLKEAYAQLCRSADALPPEYRTAFWRDPCRQQLRALHDRATQPQERGMTTEHVRPADGIPRERFVHLLSIIRRLVSEQRLDRLLENITDGAISFFRAERGFVMLADSDGRLAPHTARALGTPTEAAFSQSIAEAVFIDNEPIVATDAADDQRLRDYRSVHKLMLRSVACVPIQGPSGSLGVLYLEHRSMRGHFHDEDVELLVAFADQAALAIDKVRTLEQLRLRTTELEAANQALEIAHHEQARLVELRTEQLQQVKRELRGAKEKLEMTSGRYGIVGKSEALRQVLERVERVANAQVPVVLWGESGTGKELVARAIHQAAEHEGAPFVAVNCAAIPDGLLESELFGHTKGAFTGANREHRGLLDQAANGTLFLDEIADMPARMQASLLRVLQDGTYFPVGSEHPQQVCVRVISACREPLRQLVAAGRFREDLYYRLSVVEIEVPSLAKRRDDIPLLCEHFLRKHAKGDRSQRKRLSSAALAVLVGYDWPGNIRELEHVLVNASLLSGGEVIEPKDLSLTGRLHAVAGAASKASEVSGTEERFHDQQRALMLEALTAHHWNRAAAARALGMPRRTFYRRLSAYGIE